MDMSDSQDGDKSDLKALLPFKAQQRFNQGKYDEALQCLQKLETLLSPAKDLSVLHNIAVTSTLQAGPNIASFVEKLEQLEAERVAQNEAEGSVTSPECGFVRYNLALVHFGRKKLSKAMNVLEEMVRHLEPINERAAVGICFLYLSVVLHGTRVGGFSSQEKESIGVRAQQVVQWLEKINPGRNTAPQDDGGSQAVSSEKLADVANDIEFRFRLHLFKAKLFLFHANLKSAKKEAKSALDIFQNQIKPMSEASATQSNGKSISSSADRMFPRLPPIHVQNAAALYVKANLEFRKQNYSKCVRLLNSCQKNSVDDSVFFNNMGCIHFQTHRTSVAELYFSRALQSCFSSGASARMIGSRGELKTFVNFEVLYNNGLALLGRGKFDLAFKCFMESRMAFIGRPGVWLRIGECIVGKHRVESDPSKSHLMRGVTGSGVHRRILLPVSSSNQTPSTSTGMTLEFAASCFRNSVALSAPQEANEESQENRESSAQRSRIHQTALTNLCYVCLCLEDPLSCLSAAETILSLPDCTAPIRFLARSYAAEALAMQSRTQEAVEQLTTNEDKNLANGAAEYANLPLVDEKEGLCARVSLHVNLATVHVLKHELERAEKCVEEALALWPECAEALRLLLFIQLKKGSKEKALRVLRQCHA